MNDDSHTYRLFVSPDRTILVRWWTSSDTVEVAVRTTPGGIWGPPVVLREEDT